MIVAFTRTTDARLARLAKAIDQFVADHEKQRMAGFVVLIAENNEANQKSLRELAEAHKIAIPLTLTPKAPGSYKINPDVPITALVARRKTLTAAFAFPEPEPTDEAAQKEEVARVIAAAKKLFE